MITNGLKCTNNLYQSNNNFPRKYQQKSVLGIFLDVTLFSNMINRKVFWCFQGVEEGGTGNKWVNLNYVLSIFKASYYGRGKASYLGPQLQSKCLVKRPMGLCLNYEDVLLRQFETKS